jgi:hypothetical protein
MAPPGGDKEGKVTNRGRRSRSTAAGAQQPEKVHGVLGAKLRMNSRQKKASSSNYRQQQVPKNPSDVSLPSVVGDESISDQHSSSSLGHRRHRHRSQTSRKPPSEGVQPPRARKKSDQVSQSEAPQASVVVPPGEVPQQHAAVAAHPPLRPPPLCNATRQVRRQMGWSEELDTFNTPESAAIRSIETVETNFYRRIPLKARKKYHNRGVSKSCIVVIQGLPERLQLADSRHGENEKLLGCDQLMRLLEHHTYHPTTVSIAREKGFDSNWALVTLRPGDVENVVKKLPEQLRDDHLPSDDQSQGHTIAEAFDETADPTNYAQNLVVRRYEGGHGKSVRTRNQMNLLLAAMGVTVNWVESGELGSEYTVRWYMIDPNHSAKKKWDFWVGFLCVYVAVFVPLRLGFQLPMCPGSIWFLLDVAVDVCFLVDMPVQACTGYFEQETMKLELNSKRVRQRYYESWFKWDLLSVLPTYIFWIFYGCAQSSIARLARFAQLLRVRRLMTTSQPFGSSDNKDPTEKVFIGFHFKPLQIEADPETGQESEWKDGYPVGKSVTRGKLLQMGKVIGAVVAILFTAHLVACLWFYTGSADFNSEEKRHSNESLPEGCSGDDCTGWVEAVGLSPEGGWSGLDQKYLYSFYWSIVTLSTVGYGDITATSSKERVFSVVVTLAGCMGFAYLSSVLTSMSMKATLSEERVKRQMKEMQEFFTEKHIEPALQAKLRLIFQRAFKEQNSEEQEEFLKKQLPKNLQDELEANLEEHALAPIHKIDLFNTICSTKEQDLITKMLQYFQPLAISNGQYIYRQGNPAYEVYVVTKGKVLLQSDTTDHTSVISAVGSQKRHRLQQNRFFGEREMFIAEKQDGDRSVVDVEATRRCYCRKNVSRQQSAVVVSDFIAEMQWIEWGELVKLNERWKQLESDRRRTTSGSNWPKLSPLTIVRNRGFERVCEEVHEVTRLQQQLQKLQKEGEKDWLDQSQGSDDTTSHLSSRARWKSELAAMKERVKVFEAHEKQKKSKRSLKSQQPALSSMTALDSSPHGTLEPEPELLALVAASSAGVSEAGSQGSKSSLSRERASKIIGSAWRTARSRLDHAWAQENAKATIAEVAWVKQEAAHSRKNGKQVAKHQEMKNLIETTSQLQNDVRALRTDVADILCILRHVASKQGEFTRTSEELKDKLHSLQRDRAPPPGDGGPQSEPEPPRVQPDMSDPVQPVPPTERHDTIVSVDNDDLEFAEVEPEGI